mgnify:FL=1|jgi:CHASE2 domain-containing sensor protein|tara:strand:+ start:7103 stop:7414 length:312 start_codon:yes stop_codon:yes gene_type:complete
MKGLEEFTDLFAMAIGMVGSLMKGLKKRLKIQTIFIGMVIAGILSFSLIGVVEIFYKDLSPKVIILISFIVGWIANELTEKIDEVFEEFYQYAIDKLKKLIKK